MKRILGAILVFACLAFSAAVPALGQDRGYPVKLRSTGAFVAKFAITWTAPNEHGYLLPRIWHSGPKTSPYKNEVRLPDNATNVFVTGSIYTGLAWDPVRMVLTQRVPWPSLACFELFGTTFKSGWKKCLD